MALLPLAFGLDAPNSLLSYACMCLASMPRWPARRTTTQRYRSLTSARDLVDGHPVAEWYGSILTPAVAIASSAARAEGSTPRSAKSAVNAAACTVRTRAVVPSRARIGSCALPRRLKNEASCGPCPYGQSATRAIQWLGPGSDMRTSAAGQRLWSSHSFRSSSLAYSDRPLTTPVALPGRSRVPLYFLGAV